MAAILGPVSFIVAATVAMSIQGTSIDFLVTAVQAAAGFATLAYIFKHAKNAYIIKSWLESDIFELKASAEMRIKHFFRLRMIRNCIGSAGMLALCVFMSGHAIVNPLGSLAVALTALGLFTIVGFINRYIFFVSVVPRNIPGNFMIAATKSAH